MKVYNVQLGERYYLVTKGGYHLLRGIEITEYKYRNMITDCSESIWNGTDSVLNAQDVEILLGRWIED